MAAGELVGVNGEVDSGSTREGVAGILLPEVYFAVNQHLNRSSVHIFNTAIEN
jgi:hypothetical protein